MRNIYYRQSSIKIINLQNPMNVSQIRVLTKACRHTSISWAGRCTEEFSCRENHSMERSSAWEADIRSADQKPPSLQWNPKAHFHIRNRSPWSLFSASSILSTSSYSIYLRTKLQNKWTLLDAEWETMDIYTRRLRSVRWALFCQICANPRFRRNWRGILYTLPEDDSGCRKRKIE